MKWIHPTDDPVTFDEVYRVLVSLDALLAYLCPALHQAGLAPCPDHCYYRLEDSHDEQILKGPVISIIFETYHGAEINTYGIDISILEIHLPIEKIVEAVSHREKLMKERKKVTVTVDIETPF